MCFFVSGQDRKTVVWLFRLHDLRKGIITDNGLKFELRTSTSSNIVEFATTLSLGVSEREVYCDTKTAKKIKKEIRKLWEGQQQLHRLAGMSTMSAEERKKIDDH